MALEDMNIKQAFDISFYKKLFATKGGNLKKEAQEKNDWYKFFVGCGVSVIGVLILGLMGANIVYFSRLSTEDKDGQNDDETIGTYFPIPENLKFGLFVGKRYDNFEPYISGTDAEVKPSNITLSKLNIPPTGNSERIFGRWPYKEENFDEYDDNGHFTIRKMWLMRSIAATYIFWRALLQKIFKVMSYCSPGVKLILSLMILAVFIGGPGLLASFLSNTSSGSSSGFPAMIVFSLFMISIMQIRWETGSWGKLGYFWHALASFLDTIALTTVGTFMAIVMTLQFIGTFIPPFGPLLFNFSGTMNALGEIRQPLCVLFGFFCIVFAKLHLNKAVFSGMTVTVLVYFLMQLNYIRRSLYKKLISKKE
tara:strand:- start:2048 stop:3145 length:1098 start_codon:yes stop_codon:yes gene_type:complete